MKKRLLPVLLALTLTLPLPALAKEASTGFTDVSPEDWFAPYVVVCVEEGLLNGVGEDRFAPGQVLNSDEALVMAARVLLKANGEAEFPKGPDAQGFWDWAGRNAQQYSMGLSVDETQWYVDSWCWDPLVYLAQAGGPDLFPDGGITYATDRYTFFKALSFAAQGLELPVINTVEAVPGTRDERVLDLYRAGILAGTDLYGSFDGQAPLTRAEAAAALARLARPELRVEFALQESPYQNYTLTYLMDGESNAGLNYPLVAISSSAEDEPSGLLSLDGTLHPWPGRTPSWGLERSGEYAWFSCWNEETEDPYDQLQGLMDSTGEMAIPLGRYAWVRATQDGHFLVSDDEYGSSDAPWRLLDHDLTVAAQLPAPASVLPEGAALSFSGPSWLDLNQGLMAYWDEESGLWGYVGMDGKWVVKPTWVSASNFQRGYAVVENESGLWGCIDLAGNAVLPFQYSFLTPSRDSFDYDGPIVFAFRERDGRTGLLPLGGEPVYLPIEEEHKHIRTFQNGYGLCYSGYDHTYCWYIDPSGAPISEKFDWAGAINADGQGFVGIEGKIYRIEFETP